MLDIKQERLPILLYASAFLALFFSAFDLRLPVLPGGRENLTTSELAALFFIAAFFWWAGRNRVNLVPRRFLDVAVLAFLASNYLSAAFAVDKMASSSFSLRLTFAALLYFGISRLPRKERSIKVASAAVTASLLVVVAIGFLQGYVPWGPWSRLLSPFNEGIAAFISYDNVRVSSTLSYPTILSAFLELTMPIALTFGIWMIGRKKCSICRRLLLVAVVAVVTIVGAVQMSTYTRSSLVAMPLSILAGAVMAVFFGFGRRVWVTLGLAAVLFGATLGVAALRSEKMAVRLDLAQPQSRLGVQYSLVGEPPAVSLNSEGLAAIRVKNTGAATWGLPGEDTVSLSTRWLSFPGADEQRQIPHLKAQLPQAVAPGQEVTLNVPFKTPSEPGKYILVFDIINDANEIWFSMERVAGLDLPLEFTADASSRRFKVELPPESFNAAKPGEEAVPDHARTELWRAAIKMWQSHPLLGVGPDQFKNHYSDYLEGLKANDRLRTHDIYLEALANTGLVGLGAMVLLLAAALRAQINLLRNRSQTAGVRLMSLGLFVAIIAYLLHGFLDYFLWQTGIAIVFFAMLGLTSWLEEVSRCGSEEPAAQVLPKSVFLHPVKQRVTADAKQ